MAAMPTETPAAPAVGTVTGAVVVPLLWGLTAVVVQSAAGALDLAGAEETAGALEAAGAEEAAGALEAAGAEEAGGLTPSQSLGATSRAFSVWGVSKLDGRSSSWLSKLTDVGGVGAGGSTADESSSLDLVVVRADARKISGSAAVLGDLLVNASAGASGKVVDGDGDSGGDEGSESELHFD